MFQRVGGTARGLTHVGDRAFFPMGAALVRDPAFTNRAPACR